MLGIDSPFALFAAFNAVAACALIFVASGDIGGQNTEKYILRATIATLFSLLFAFAALCVWIFQTLALRFAFYHNGGASPPLLSAVARTLIDPFGIISVDLVLASAILLLLILKKYPPPTLASAAVYSLFSAAFLAANTDANLLRDVFFAPTPVYPFVMRHPVAPVHVACALISKNLMLPTALVVLAAGQGKLKHKPRKIPLLASIFSLLGLATGMLWAGEIQGWGGMWNWDPVENFALANFLLITVSGIALYSHKIQKNYRLLKITASLLIASVLTLNIAIRTGILATNHAYQADFSAVLPYLVGMLCVAVAVAAHHWHALPSDIPHETHPLVDRCLKITLAYAALLALFTLPSAFSKTLYAQLHDIFNITFALYIVGVLSVLVLHNKYNAIPTAVVALAFACLAVPPTVTGYRLFLEKNSDIPITFVGVTASPETTLHFLRDSEAVEIPFAVKDSKILAAPRPLRMHNKTVAVLPVRYFRDFVDVQIIDYSPARRIFWLIFAAFATFFYMRYSAYVNKVVVASRHNYND